MDLAASEAHRSALVVGLEKRFGRITINLDVAEDKIACIHKALNDDVTLPTVANFAQSKNTPSSLDTPVIRKLRATCSGLGLSSSVFAKVPIDYYDRDLEARRGLLDAPHTGYLCKTIVMKNTGYLCKTTGCGDRNNSQYYCMVFHYTTKIDAEKILKHSRGLNPGLGKRQFNFRLAPEEESAQLTGYGHNAVVPIGMNASIPLVLSQALLDDALPYFWMGGGEVDWKLRTDLMQFIQ
eukprot:gene2932-3510_t